jgi:hypothetical protein
MRHRNDSQTEFTVCSLCLRVLRGSDWIEAERVISEVHSYESEAAPRLKSAVCDLCAESIFSRRAQAQVGEPIAA